MEPVWFIKDNKIIDADVVKLENFDGQVFYLNEDEYMVKIGNNLYVCHYNISVKVKVDVIKPTSDYTVLSYLGSDGNIHYFIHDTLVIGCRENNDKCDTAFSKVVGKKYLLVPFRYEHYEFTNFYFIVEDNEKNVFDKNRFYTGIDDVPTQNVWRKIVLIFNDN